MWSGTPGMTTRAIRDMFMPSGVDEARRLLSIVKRAGQFILIPGRIPSKREFRCLFPELRNCEQAINSVSVPRIPVPGIPRIAALSRGRKRLMVGVALPSHAIRRFTAGTTTVICGVGRLVVDIDDGARTTERLVAPIVTVVPGTARR